MAQQHEGVAELPMELVDAIIDNLQDDRSAMLKAGIFGEIWYERTRRHLFRRIRIGGKGDPHIRCANLRMVLKRRPHLSSYMEALSLNLGDLRYWSGDQLVGGDFVELIGLLGCLKEVEIEGANDRCRWRYLPSIVRATLYDLFKRPTVTIVKLSRVHDVDILALVRCQQINELTLHCVGSIVTHADYLRTSRDVQIPKQSPPSVSGHSTPPRRRLLNIAFDDPGRIISSGARYASVIPNFARPTVLRVCPSLTGSGTTREWRSVLEQFGPTVEVLWVAAWGDASTSSFANCSTALELVPRLRRWGFEMALDVSFVSLGIAANAFNQADFKAIIGHRNSGLVLEFLIDPREEIKKDMGRFLFSRDADAFRRYFKALETSPSWGIIQDVLHGSAGSRGIGEVCVSIRVDKKTEWLAGQVWASFQETIKKNMQLLENSGRLKFRVDRLSEGGGAP